MLAAIDQIKEKTGLPYRAICSAVRLPYPSFIRWHVRRRRAVPVVQQPGPAKIQPPDFGRLTRDIAQLSHGRDRTQGTGTLHDRYASSVSRRELRSMVALARHDANAVHRQNLRRIQWNVPNVAWAMDPCEYKQPNGDKIYLNQMQDLASRYKFTPMTGDVRGEGIADHLAATFDRFGAPLFLKRDNGSNLNHAAVNRVLADYYVLPINSPVHYPPYNGAIEEAQTELKKELNKKLTYDTDCPREHLDAYASTVEHDLNHYPRPCLNGSNSCQIYFSGKRRFTLRERRDAYTWITNLQQNMLCCDGVQPQVAWRIAVEVWLKRKRFITVTANGKVSPSFF